MYLCGSWEETEDTLKGIERELNKGTITKVCAQLRNINKALQRATGPAKVGSCYHP